MKAMDAAADILVRYEEALHYINIDAVLLGLRVQGIVHHHEYIDVVNKARREKVLFLQEVLSMGGDNAFPAFIQVLHKNHHVDLANRLNEEWKRRNEGHGASSGEGGRDVGPNEMPRATEVIPGAQSGSTASHRTEAQPTRFPSSSQDATTNLIARASQNSESRDLNVERPGASEPNRKRAFIGYVKQFQQQFQSRKDLIVASIAVLFAIGVFLLVSKVSLARAASNTGHSGEKTPSRIQINEEQETWDLIRANRRKLRDDYNLDFEELLLSLSEKKVFTAPEEKQIRSKENRKLFDELFEILVHKNPKKFIPVFLHTLTEIGRQDKSVGSIAFGVTLIIQKQSYHQHMAYGTEEQSLVRLAR
ncbi:unnamed protein product [Darwinula stevensoni]|uniref:CARD domain-containing protein n=1 Tax=Darwinula stevensoni TaxID=69355 RepID=A0A7R9AEQ7_9CRUS|nr:unnamed protein product [Darwinula stevensoni]CAG0902223.1 unnamed protein product [Darwinula stevensoni]